MPYVDALRELGSRAQDLILVDCMRLLADSSKSRILQHDGFHLSRLGQKLVGEAVGQAIVADIIANGRVEAPRYQFVRDDDFRSDAVDGSSTGT